MTPEEIAAKYPSKIAHGKAVTIAKVCHQANKALCEAFGDYSQPHWDAAPDWQRQSAITGVEFNVANPTAPASASHDSWLEEKRRTGWRYGDVKDPEAKTHPCFVPYEQLPREQQAKDHVFKAIVAAMV
ncbi:RyR domain-containing protein [Rhodopseudomonas sp. RCAM05734]|uniref:RyR domain-containing protein n=1 Tax=Rhodopseudomonas sp. RCAM05734 TaxID=3457549 RepID=UPI00404452E5